MNLVGDGGGWIEKEKEERVEAEGKVEPKQQRCAEMEMPILIMNEYIIRSRLNISSPCMLCL